MGRGLSSLSPLHHQRRPSDRILALQLINVLRGATRRPVTKLKEPTNGLVPRISSCTGLHIDFERLKKLYRTRPPATTKAAESMRESAFQRGASTFKCSCAEHQPKQESMAGVRRAGTRSPRPFPPLVVRFYLFVSHVFLHTNGTFASLILPELSSFF